MRGERRVSVRYCTPYSVTSGVFLLSADNGTGALSSVQSTLTTDDGLTLSSTAARSASDLGDLIPVV